MVAGARVVRGTWAIGSSTSVVGIGSVALERADIRKTTDTTTSGAATAPAVTSRAGLQRGRGSSSNSSSGSAPERVA